MSHKIRFEEIEWESKTPGQRFKKHAQNGQQIRLVELTPEFEEANWCSKGHAGFVLAGVLELEFENETLIYREGDGFYMAEGAADHHKARALTPIVRFVLFEKQ